FPMGDETSSTGAIDGGTLYGRDTLLLKCGGEDGSEIHFKVRNTVRMQKLMCAYASRTGYNVAALRFMYNGERVKDDDTPTALWMQDGDYIEVYYEQSADSAAGPSWATHLSKNEREERIKKLQEEEKSSPVSSVSRSCRVCFADNPLRRAAFIACGHIVCQVCALRIAGKATEEGRRLVCPYCRADTRIVPLFEDTDSSDEPPAKKARQMRANSQP
ncbi:hypothetical protein PENTCL1PPCAC_23942, partial [Pristionchus entomophagus]